MTEEKGLRGLGLFNVLRGCVMIGASEEFNKQLKANKDNLDYQDEDGNTILHYAASTDHYNVAKGLLNHGASKRIRNKEGKAPVDVATPALKELLSFKIRIPYVRVNK